MSISRLIWSNSVLAEPSLVATNELYLSKSTKKNESNVLVDKFIVPKNIRGGHWFENSIDTEKKTANKRMAPGIKGQPH